MMGLMKASMTQWMALIQTAVYMDAVRGYWIARYGDEEQLKRGILKKLFFLIILSNVFEDNHRPFWLSP